MTASHAPLSLLAHERLAPLATSITPAWLWSSAGKLIWANAAGAAVLGARSAATLIESHRVALDHAGRQIERLAPSLTYAGPPRLERLRGLGAGIGDAAICACARIKLADSSPAVLAVSAEPAGAKLSLAERVERLLAAMTEPVAAYTPNGALVYANKPASALLAGAASIAETGADALAAEALRLGHASGETLLGGVSIRRLGEQEWVVLLVELPEQAPPAAPRVKADHPGDLAKSAQTPSAGSERRQPLRFVWQIDASGRFTLSSNEFAELVGGETPRLIGRPWLEIAGKLDLDPAARIEQAIASHDTFSGIAVAWPTADSRRVQVELSGLPVFDQGQNFCGYRGFGVCREITRPGERTGDLAPASAGKPAQSSAGPTQYERVAESRPILSVVPPAKNVVPFRGPGTPDKRPPLTPVERLAFREIAKALGARCEGEEGTIFAAPEAAGLGEEPDTATAAVSDAVADNPGATLARDEGLEQRQMLALLDRLPLGVLIYRGERVLHANKAALEWTAHADLAALAADGGLARVLASHGAETEDGAQGARLFTVAWNGGTALMLLLKPPADAQNEEAATRALRHAEAEARELRAILDTATDGVILLDRNGCILSLNRSAEALFGYEAGDVIGQPFADLFAPESRRAALDYFDGLSRNGVASLINDGREAIGRVRGGGLVPLFMTMGRISDAGEKYCAVLRDITQWKRAEEELLTAKRLAERSSSAKTDFLARISHEIRTPLNAIIGFSEIMMEQRFGPIGNERYREYLRDIHASGEHVISLVNDLLDLSKVEAGKLDLTFTSVQLNDLVQQCVALMQPQANRERIIIRTSLLPRLPPVVVDARSVRQIMLNLLSNSIKFTGAGGQVIVSTAFTDSGEIVLRVRDTGIGMSDEDIAKAMEPFRQIATSDRFGSGGTGLGLPLTKALAEANRASFAIKSAVNSGTLIEITFPATRVLAE